MAGTSADYSQASYAQTADQGPSLYPDAASILHRPGYDYDHAVGIRRCPPRDVDEHREVAGGAFEAIVELASGQEAMLLIEAAAAGVFRIRFGASGSSYHETSDMLADPPPPVPEHGLIVEEHPSRYRLRLGGHSLCLDRNGFGLCLLREDGSEIFRIETTTHAGKHCGGPLGFRLPPGSRPQPYLGWRIANGERFFGLGEKWNACEKTGTTATIWSNDTAGSNTTDLSYKAVPVLFSTRGWGLFLHDYHRSRWEVGSFSYVAGTVLTEGPVLDCFLIAGDDLPAVQRRFTGLTGRPQMPPKWAFGTWVSRCQYDDAQTAQWAMQGMRSRGIPADVIHLDPKWMHVHWYWRIGVDACDFVWNEDGFPDHEALFRDWAADGWSVSLWINPYLPEGEPIYEEAREQGFLLRDERGGIARLSHGEAVGMVDFTHPAAREWWQGHCEAVLRAGAAVLKPDYGDRVPETALAHDGSSGRELHNRYLHLYAETAYHAAAAVHGRGIVWRRGGYVGTQRYPGTWAGDTQTTWEAFRCCLRGGLSVGFTGECFWSHDIGGFVGDMPSPELYIRWLQLGMLSPFTRFHGNGVREPWHYGDTAVAVARYYGRLRYRLIPYLLALAEEAVAEGIPLQRHCALACPDEPGMAHLDDQFLLGSDLLVAPVQEAGARQRLVCLPRGTWYVFEDDQRLAGGSWHEIAAPLERMPVLVRGGALLPSYEEAQQHLKEAVPDLLQWDCWPASAPRRVARHFDDGGGMVRASHDSGPAGGRITIHAEGRPQLVHLHGIPAFAIQAPAEARIREADGISTVDCPAVAGLTIDYTCPE